MAYPKFYRDDIQRFLDNLVADTASFLYYKSVH